MSIKRIALISAVAVTAMALVGGGFAAAQNKGESTTLITTPGPETTSQAYRGATTSELSQPGVDQLAAAYAADCNADPGTSGTTFTLTVTGSPTRTGQVTFSGYGDPVVTSLSGGQASHTYPPAAAGKTISYEYEGDGASSGYGCSGGAPFEKATPTSCNVTRSTNGKTLTMTVVGTAGTPTGYVRFPNASGTGFQDIQMLNGSNVVSRTYSPNAPGTITVTYQGNDTYKTCSFQSVN